MMAKRNIAISKPCLGDEEWHAAREPLQSGWLTQGPKVAEFEKIFAARHQVKHALATTSCTTALHLILAALDIGPGDEVIVPAFTWVATANVVLYCGATPVFVDIDVNNFNLDIQQVAKKISPRTKAIIAVHLFGLCADVPALLKVAGNIPVIEDAACAAGSAHLDKPAGSLGFAAAFSFHPRKSVTTGEGGMVTTQDDDFAEKVNMLRNHGASISEEQRHAGPRPYLLPDFNLLGFNYRMTDLQASVGIVQLKKLDQFIHEREKMAQQYYEKLHVHASWLRLPVTPAGYHHGWQSFVCFVDKDKAPHSRNEIMEHLQSRGVSTRPGTHAVHMLGLYRDQFGLKPDYFPVARDCDQQTLAIPLHNCMNQDDIDYVIQALSEINT